MQKHGLVTMKEVNKKLFVEQYLPKLANSSGVPLREINYSESQTKVQVYSFHVDLMLILRARLFTLKKLINTQVIIVALRLI